MKYLNLCWILTFLIIFSYSINADVCECNDCSSCTDALNNESCTEVRLTADITDYNERCIDNPENFTVKTFDCQGHTIDGTGSKIGIYLITKTDNIIKNCIITDWNTGIYLGTGSDSNQIINNNISNSVDGIRIDFSLNNQLINNVISSNVRYGIYLDGSNNTSVTDNSAINNLEGDFGSVDNSLNNSVINLNIGGTLVSFESKDIILKNSTNPGNLPAGLGHIGKFINVINNSEDSWLALNISYLDSELGEINENTLRIWKNNGSWFECTTFANNCGIDKVNNVVYANITNFGSIFAPLGEIEGSGICECNDCSSCTDALNNESCTEVRLTTDIIDYTSSCIDNPRFFENKTFDCRGHMIDGDDSGMYGIYLNGKDNNLIKNCIISDFIYGINLDNSGNNTIENNSISSCTDTGLVVGGNNNEIKFNTIYNNQIGVEVRGEYNKIVSNVIYGHNNVDAIGIWDDGYYTLTFNNTLYDNYYCIEVYGEGDNDYVNVSQNNLTNCEYGIYVTSSNYNSVERNTIINSSEKGIYLDSSSHNNISRNNLSSIGDDGIYLSGFSDENLIAENNVSDSNQGIGLSSSRNNTIIDNTISYSNNQGIYAYDDSNATKIIGNKIYTAEDAIDVRNSLDCIVKNNLINEVSSYGIYFENVNFSLIENNSLFNTAGISIDYSESNNVTLNKIINSSYDGIVSSQTRNDRITKNYIENVVESGIELTGYANNEYVSENTIINSSFGIYLDQRTENNKIVQNYIYNLTSETADTAILLIDESNYNLIDGNIIKLAPYGIYLGNNVENNVTNNVIEDVTSGIYLSGVNGIYVY
ncbi:MAG: right-handed parallel beta-helix repeat-containing protein, partial [Candidatus Micrarchaeia archaeon]